MFFVFPILSAVGSALGTAASVGSAVAATAASVGTAAASTAATVGGSMAATGSGLAAAAGGITAREVGKAAVLGGLSYAAGMKRGANEASQAYARQEERSRQAREQRVRELDEVVRRAEAEKAELMNGY